MKISFKNTEHFLKPKNSDVKAALPDGYEVSFKIPPQGSDLMSEEEKKKTVQKAKTAMIIEIVLAFIFTPIM